jgi:hypothetical protein
MAQSPPIVLALVVSVCGRLDGPNHLTAVPTALYGAVLMMAGFAYYLLQQAHKGGIRS